MQMKMQENVRIFPKMQENARILRKTLPSRVTFITSFLQTVHTATENNSESTNT